MRWTTNKIGSLCEITSSKRIYANEYVSEGTPFFRGKEVIEKFNGAQNISTELFISKNRYEEISLKFGAPQAGDLLLTSVGTLGVPYYVSSNDEFYFKDGNLTWFRSFNGLCSKFVYYWLQSPNGKAQLQKSTIGTSQSAFTIILLKQMEISAPSIEFQNKIASTLSTYDDLIENNRRRMELLEDAARQVYQEWFVRLRFPGYENTRIVDGVPEGWQKGPLETALVLQRGFDLPSQSRVEGTVPIFASTGVNGYHNVAKVKAPGIVTGRSGSLGKVHYVHEDYWPLNTTLWVKEFRLVSPLFAYFLLSSLGLDQYNGGVSVPTLDRKVVHKIEVVIPTARLQALFGDCVLPMFTQLRNLDIFNQKLRTARNLLLPKLMSGEISV